MSNCEKCGSQTPRARFCKHCALDARYGQALIDESEQSETPTLTIECCGCGLVREVSASARKICPDCEYEGYRTLEVV